MIKNNILCLIFELLRNNTNENDFQESSFHVSILWCVGDRRNELQALLPQFRHLLEHSLSIDDSNLMIEVKNLFCKIGNKLYSFHL